MRGLLTSVTPTKIYKWRHLLGNLAQCSTQTQAQVLLTSEITKMFKNGQFRNDYIFPLFPGNEMAKANHLRRSTDRCVTYRQLFRCRSTLGPATRGMRKCFILHSRFTFHDHALCEFLLVPLNILFVPKVHESISLFHRRIRHNYMRTFMN